MEETKKKPLGMLLTGLVFALGIFILSCIAIRSARMKDVDFCDDVLFDDATVEAYREGGLHVYTYGLKKRFESVGSNQLLQLKYMYYLPETKQLQVTVKYNTSYADAPSAESIPFDLYLRDGKSEETRDFFYRAGEKGGYGYIRLCFSDIVFSDAEEYTLYVVLPDEDSGEGKLLSKFTLYDATSACALLELTEKNAAALMEAAKK